MTLEVRTRMLGFFPYTVPPSRSDSAVAGNREISPRNVHLIDLILDTAPRRLEMNASVHAPFARYAGTQNAQFRPADCWRRDPGIPRSVRKRFSGKERASLNGIRRHGNFRSYGVKVRDCALELQPRRHCSAAMLAKAGLSDVAAFVGAQT
jgi:hypothetical protein